MIPTDSLLPEHGGLGNSRKRTLMSCKLSNFWTVVVIAALIAQAQASGRRDRYVVVNLGTLGGTFSSAYGINNLGWVIGAANLAGDQTEHPVLWRDGSIIDLGTLGGENGAAG